MYGEFQLFSQCGVLTHVEVRTLGEAQPDETLTCPRCSRMVGNNYNQTLKELRCHFSEHRAMALVCKLEKYMMQLVQIMHKVVELTIRYENHRIGKEN